MSSTSVQNNSANSRIADVVSVTVSFCSGSAKMADQ